MTSSFQSVSILVVKSGLFKEVNQSEDLSSYLFLDQFWL